MAPLSGTNASSSALFRTNSGHVYANAIPTLSSFRRSVQVPENSISRIHTKSILCFRKIKDQSNSLHCVRPADHAPFLETHGNSVRLGRSAMAYVNVTTCLYCRKDVRTCWRTLRASTSSLRVWGRGT